MIRHKPINIKIRFGNEIVKLKTSEDRVTTRSGVEIYVQKRQSDFRLFASIPDGSLEKYKHLKPEIVSCEWVENAK